MNNKQSSYLGHSLRWDRAHPRHRRYAPKSCDDGFAGIALVARRDAFDGRGTVLFSDGSEGTFAFGRAAARARARAEPPSEGVASAVAAR